MPRYLTRSTMAAASAATLVVGVGLSALPVAPAIAKPAAAKYNVIDVNLAQQTAKSSTHKTLLVTIGGSKTANPTSNSTASSVGFTVNAKGSPEGHGWTFPASNSSVQFNPATGKGSIKTGKQAKPYGAVNVTLKSDGKAQKSHCNAYTTVTQPVAVKGTWSFNTRSKGKHKWGKAGGHGKFKGKSSVFYTSGQTDTSCGGTTTPCFTSIGWGASHGQFGTTTANTTISGGGIGTNRASLFASRFNPLAKPKGAVRNDSISLTDKNQKFSVTGGKATVKVGAAKGVTGSATLASPNQGESQFAFSCGKGGTKKQQRTFWDSPYKNGKSPLVIHEQIEGSFKLPNSPAGSGAGITKSFVSNN